MPHGPYSERWRRYAWLQAACWLSLPCIFLVRSTPGFFLYGAAVCALSTALFRWRCPRCGEPFHMRGLWRNSFTRRCLNCGLAKWAAGPDDA